MYETAKDVGLVAHCTSQPKVQAVIYLHGQHPRLVPLLLIGIPSVVHQHSNTLLQLRSNGSIGPLASTVRAL